MVLFTVFAISKSSLIYWAFDSLTFGLLRKLPAPWSLPKCGLAIMKPNDGSENRRMDWRPTFTLKSLMIAIAAVSALTFWFAAEYEFVNIVATTTSTSPDQKRRIVVQSKTHKSLFRQFRTVESTIFMSNGAVGMIQRHWLSSPETKSSNPPNFQATGTDLIRWSSDSQSVTYPVTDAESATIWLSGDRKTEINLLTDAVR